MDFSPLVISAKTASLSIAVTFVAGLFAANFTAGIRQTRWKMILDGILTLPLVLPPTVAGFFLLYIFGIRGPVGKFLVDFFGLKVAFSWGATVLAASVISFPLMYRSARGAIEQVDKNLIYAARTLGMSEWKIFRKVTLPTAMPGIASGAVLAFARGLGEYGATTMIAGNIPGRTRTLPVAIASEANAGDMDTAYRYVLVIIGFSLLVVGLMNYFAAKEK